MDGEMGEEGSFGVPDRGPSDRLLIALSTCSRSSREGARTVPVCVLVRESATGVAESGGDEKKWSRLEVEWTRRPKSGVSSVGTGPVAAPPQQNCSMNVE